MRRRILCLNLNLFFLASVVSAQTPAVKVCVTQDNDDGYDALRPAQEIASRKLADGTRVGVVAVTPGAPSPDWERLADRPAIAHPVGECCGKEGEGTRPRNLTPRMRLQH